MGEPRTIIFSQRNLDHRVYQCGKYEFEDVVREVEGADIIASALPIEARTTRFRRRALNRVKRQLGLPQDYLMTPARIEHHYKIFFTALNFPDEVIYLRKLVGWREHCQHKICFLGEVWNKDREALRVYAPLLREFDHIFLHIGASLPMVAELIKRPCHQLSGGVDAIRFCPFPNPSARSIDCYSIGRRSPTTHEMLLQLAKRPNPRFFYIYDTAKNFEVINPFEHRCLLAETIKRSRYFISYKHNLNLSDKTGGDEALGGRFFEGIAGGAVVLGAAPDCPEYTAHFDWTDAMIPLDFKPTNLEALLAELDLDRDRTTRIRARNVSASLRRHDWVYRWATILQTIGLKTTAALDTRLARLEELAHIAELPLLK